MAAIAQLVEHRIVIPVVAGSSPVGRPNFFPKAPNLKPQYISSDVQNFDSVRTCSCRFAKFHQTLTPWCTEKPAKKRINYFERFNYDAHHIGGFVLLQTIGYNGCLIKMKNKNLDEDREVIPRTMKVPELFKNNTGWLDGNNELRNAGSN